MFKDSKIYLAGHTGLIGSALLDRLRSGGYLRVVIRTRRQLELTDQPAVRDFFQQEKPEFVFLAAGLTGGIEANKTFPADFLRTNLAIQQNVFEAARESAVRRLVFYGSSCVYPRDAVQPIREEYLLTGPVEETSAAYAVAKIAGISACRAYNIQEKSQRFIALIPNSTFGPADNFDPDTAHVVGGLIHRLHQAKVREQKDVVLWGSGRPRREFIFSGDVADASVFAMENADKLENRHYNVGPGVDYSVRELAGIIAGIAGYQGKISWDTSKPDGAARKLLDSSRFLNLGWKPKTGLEEGLRITYDWYLKNIAKIKKANCKRLATDGRR